MNNFLDFHVILDLNQGWVVKQFQNKQFPLEILKLQCQSGEGKFHLFNFRNRNLKKKIF